VRRAEIARHMQEIADLIGGQSKKATEQDYQWERMSHFYRDVQTAIDQLGCGYEKFQQVDPV